MVGRPGRLQVGFTAGVLDPGLWDNTALKYWGRGLKTGRNIEVDPTGGFHQADGLRRIGAVPASAARGFAFTASDGSAFDAICSEGGESAGIDFWSMSAKVDTIATPYTAAELPTLTFAQQLDTGLVFHVDHAPLRVKYLGSNDFDTDSAPFTGVPTYDYGGDYDNGVPAVWSLEFDGLNDESSVFILTVSNVDTEAITYSATTATMATRIAAALAKVAILNTGFAVAADGDNVKITFSGDGNEGDGWAVSGTVVNEDAAAIVAYHTTVGVEPGEDIMSDARGWPRCGCFYLQRLILAGLKGLPNAWLFSRAGDYYNFDQRITDANGPAVVPMDVPGGEGIEAIAAQRNLLIWTNAGEYWIQERVLDKTKPPTHVQAAQNGIKRAVAPLGNEGAALFSYANGGVIGELRYTDIDGNFTTSGISILSSHLIVDVVAMAIRRPSPDTSDGALLAVVLADGTALTAKLLREQDVTAFVARPTDGRFIDTFVNGRNELCFLVERTSGNGTERTLERFEPGLLFDGATTTTNESPSAAVSGLGHHEGRVVWAEGDGEIMGPFTVASGAITLPKAVSEVTVGRWPVPLVETLPPSRVISSDGNVVLRRKGRVHSAWVSVEDTTSIAVGANGGDAHDVALRRFGDIDAGEAELSTGVTGQVSIRGMGVPFGDFPVEPTLTITQLRPGRLKVRSLTLEAQL
jgi:hypothetical protein